MSTLGKVDRVAFGLFEADLHSGELWKAGHRVRLPRQPFRVLAALLERPGDIVTREELRLEIWGVNTNVDFDQALAAAINKIREALGDSADNPRFIQTLSKRGYRFIAPVTLTLPASAARPLDQQVRPELQSSTNVVTGESDIERGDSQAVASAQAQMPAVSNEESTGSVSPLALFQGNDFVSGERLPGAVAGQVSTSRVPAMLWYLGTAAVALAAGVTVGQWLLPQERTAPPLRIDQVTHYVPISLGPPNPESFLTLATDGNRILTSVMVNGLPRLSAIDAATGQVQGIAVPEEIASNSLTDISKDGSRLLLRSQQSAESEQPLWAVPSAGGSGRRVPGVVAHDAAWMPDGTGILYATGNDLMEISPSEETTAYARLPGRAFWLRWSPNGKLLRFTLFDPVTHATALWEIESGSRTPRPLQLATPEHLSACCGVWLPNGESYVFQANDNLWELKGLGRNATLTQLTNGPLRSLSPVAARSGNRIFFVGLEAPSGLQQLDLERHEFHSAPAFLADANRIEYSRDGMWVAWADTHERLWRAHASDGSDKIRLTSDALEVFLAHWSPDGKRLAVMARKRGGVWQTYLIDANGGRAEALLDETRNSADPDWSPNGESLVFGREPDLMGKESGPHTLQIIDLSTHRIEEIPDSEGLFSPRWSPDGRWIVALSLGQKNVMLYDVALRHWQRLAATSAADPVWSANSKAVYVHAFLADREPILRLEVPTGVTETVADLGTFSDGKAANYFFGGLTTKGEPLVQPRVGTGNLYSMDLFKP